ncbi:MAG: sucrase ferredoxin [Candidatus Eremiobacteraeota bacterium]|nr:sucrase ferredoxin [Candidatus Eremiobacteraeota bacterium]
MIAAFRCAVQAELRGDSMLGTAPPQARVLLVHQPGPWGPRGLCESRCDPEVARRIDAAAADAGMRLQTIRRPGKHEVGRPAGGYHVGIADTRVGAASITWWRTDDLAEIAVELESGWPRLAPSEIDTAPLYLVCAHGRHDACCALRGRPVAQALQRVRPGRVWETTHLGGDRFAANLLILPTGQLYGRVPPAVAPDLADRTDAGEVVPGLMRGRIGLSPIAQAALVYAHDRLGIVTRDALVVGSVRQIDAQLSQVMVDAPRGTIVVTVAVETSSGARLTCHGPEGARAREYRGVAIGEVDADAKR